MDPEISMKAQNAVSNPRKFLHALKYGELIIKL